LYLVTGVQTCALPIWTIWRGRRRRKFGSRRPDKGHEAMYALLAQVIRGDSESPDPDGYLIATLATIAAQRSLRSGAPEPVVPGEQDVDLGP
jgi:hypothetical protein